MSFGPWLLTVFRMLAKCSGACGTPFDPFGYTAERQHRAAADRRLRGAARRDFAGSSTPTTTIWRSASPPSRKKSAATATSRRVTSRLPRPTRPCFSTNSAPAARRSSRPRSEPAEAAIAASPRPRSGPGQASAAPVPHAGQFPEAGKLAGNFQNIAPRRRFSCRIPQTIQCLSGKFPARPSREFFAREQGIFRREQGICPDSREMFTAQRRLRLSDKRGGSRGGAYRGSAPSRDPPRPLPTRKRRGNEGRGDRGVKHGEDQRRLTIPPGPLPTRKRRGIREGGSRGEARRRVCAVSRSPQGPLPTRTRRGSRKTPFR